MIQKKKFSDAIAANISVVGGLIGNATKDKDGLMPKSAFMPRENISLVDFDSIITPGQYYMFEPKGNNRPDMCSYGGIVVFNFLDAFIIQVAFDVFGHMEFRGRRETLEWTDWVSVKL